MTNINYGEHIFKIQAYINDDFKNTCNMLALNITGKTWYYKT